MRNSTSIKEFQLINAGGKMELEYHHFANCNEMLYLGNSSTLDELFSIKLLNGELYNECMKVTKPKPTDQL